MSHTVPGNRQDIEKGFVTLERSPTSQDDNRSRKLTRVQQQQYWLILIYSIHHVAGIPPNNLTNIDSLNPHNNSFCKERETETWRWEFSCPRLCLVLIITLYYRMKGKRLFQAGLRYFSKYFPWIVNIYTTGIISCYRGKGYILCMLFF